MKAHAYLKLAMDELRMQMLGLEVLLGFQFSGILQDGFASLSLQARLALVLSMALIILTLGFLVSVPAQHRIVGQGDITRVICVSVNRTARFVMLPFCAALALNGFVVSEAHFGLPASIAIAVVTFIVALFILFGLAMALRFNPHLREDSMPDFTDEEITLHDRIDHMLTEARVVLPGAQALLGFQFIAILMGAFGTLPESSRLLHFAALALVALSILLLIAPAAIHRITFRGHDTETLHRIGSLIVGIALFPLALGISADFYVALEHVLRDSGKAAIGGALAFLTLVSLWYLLPLFLRAKRSP